MLDVSVKALNPSLFHVEGLEELCQVLFVADVFLRTDLLKDALQLNGLVGVLQQAGFVLLQLVVVKFCPFNHELDLLQALLPGRLFRELLQVGDADLLLDEAVEVVRKAAKTAALRVDRFLQELNASALHLLI